MRPDISDVISRVTGSAQAKTSSLGGGCIGDVYKVRLKNGETVVAKVGGAGSGLELEGHMLQYLKERS
ncbi:MAG: fructosamine kinase, partial [Rhodospirillaceae bacterium]|nr:fructosamine kinase [Rhodospirillaceae bacterium]